MAFEVRQLRNLQWGLVHQHMEKTRVEHAMQRLPCNESRQEQKGIQTNLDRSTDRPESLLAEQPGAHVFEESWDTLCHGNILSSLSKPKAR